MCFKLLDHAFLCFGRRFLYSDRHVELEYLLPLLAQFVYSRVSLLLALLNSNIREQTFISTKVSYYNYTCMHFE